MPTTKSSKPRSRKRNLDAFAIASAEQTQASSRSHRLGEVVQDEHSKKKQRTQDDGSGDDEAASKTGKRRSKLDEEASEGSDSDGNKWALGHVDLDDDSEIDSDEAFDLEDEKRFAHINFASSKKTKGKKKEDNSIDLNESSSGKYDERDDDEESLGDDAIDLAQMLDDYSKGNNTDESTNDIEGSSDEFEGFSEEDEADNEHQITKLQSLVQSLHPESKVKSNSTHVPESDIPSAAGPSANGKFDIRHFLEASSGPQLLQLGKKLGSLPKALKKDPKLAPPLPKGQKDQLDRIAANEKANQTLERWVDSVKQIRRAEHVQFPLYDSEENLKKDTSHLLPAIQPSALNPLESTIYAILLESGLATEEKDSQSHGDVLPDHSIPVQEMLQRRSELRRARELLFREEQKAKRIKKIKSKAYRRVHRKERERLALLDEDSDEDREAHDRRRAEERISTKHRDSKWAKQMKKSGRTIWDDEVRYGVVDMARRSDELRQKIEGKATNGNNQEDMTDEEEFDSDNQSGAEDRYLKMKLDDIAGSGTKGNSRLGSMKFMLRAEQALKTDNAQALTDLKRSLSGENADDISDDENVGRKLFGPVVVDERPKDSLRNEFEEPEFEEFNSDEEPGPVLEPLASSVHRSMQTPLQKPKQANARDPNFKRSNGTISQHDDNGATLSQQDNGWTTVSYRQSSEHSDSDIEDKPPTTNAEIIQQAFAGDDVELAFDQEKQVVVADEDEKLIDASLPGWGSWAGEGTSKKELNRAKGKNMRKQEGIKPHERKDANLKHVIINQKRLKGNTGYLASTLPFPFTNRAEYERSIRMPIGNEWNVKNTFHEITKPRILVKLGTIVKPMKTPIA